MTKMLGSFDSTRQAANMLRVMDAKEQALPEPVEGPEADQELIDAELTRRHAEIAKRVRGFSEVLQRLSKCGPLSEWLDMPLEAIFQHHRVVARENIALRHTLASLQGQEKGEAAPGLKEQAQVAAKQIEALKAHIDRLESNMSPPGSAYESDGIIADLEERLEAAEDSAQQWYAYAQELEQEIAEMRQEALRSVAEIATLKGET